MFSVLQNEQIAMLHDPTTILSDVLADGSYALDLRF